MSGVSVSDAVRIRDPRQFARSIRLQILKTAFAAGKGHLGSALSVCEILAALGLVANQFGTSEEARDRIILSKGHSSLALYCALVELGVHEPEVLSKYCKDNSLLQTHPDEKLAGVEFSTGSLGQGIGYGVGVALAAKLLNRGFRTFVILSDSELNEGSTLEAAAIAGTQSLSSLVVVLDLNGQQALGYTRDVLLVGNPSVTWAELGWETEEVAGHDVDALISALHKRRDAQRPKLVIAHTVAGKGVSFMERRIEWHYLPMTRTQFEMAVAEVTKG